jgi:hypothetical protein
MTNGWIALVAGAAVAVGSPALADVLCRTKKGKVTIRAACKKKESAVNLADLGGTGPQGPQGPAGPEGPAGAAGTGLVGLESVTASATDAALANNAFIETTATCAADKYVVMGNCRDSLGMLTITTGGGAGQTGPGDAFRCRGRNETGGTIAVTISVDVLCVPFPS